MFPHWNHHFDAETVGAPHHFANPPPVGQLRWNPDELPPQMRYLLGDQHYNTPLLRAICRMRAWILAATERIFHNLRSVVMENFNEHFKSIFEGHTQVPTKGRVATQRWALGAVFVYQVALVYLYEHSLDLNDELKAFPQSGLTIYDQAAASYSWEAPRLRGGPHGTHCAAIGATAHRLERRNL